MARARALNFYLTRRLPLPAGLLRAALAALMMRERQPEAPSLNSQRVVRQSVSCGICVLRNTNRTCEPMAWAHLEVYLSHATHMQTTARTDTVADWSLSDAGL